MIRKFFLKTILGCGAGHYVYNKLRSIKECLRWLFAWYWRIFDNQEWNIHYLRVYWGPCKTPMVERFSSNSSWLLAVNYFHKECHHAYLNMPLLCLLTKYSERSDILAFIHFYQANSRDVFRTLSRASQNWSRASFDHSKIAKSIFFFQQTRLLLWNTGFIINISEDFIKNDLRFQVKLSTEK